MAQVYNALETLGEYRDRSHFPRRWWNEEDFEDKWGWIVVEIEGNREDCLRAQSNFTVAMRILGEESDKVEICYFGGWSRPCNEIIIVHPDLHDKAQDIAGALADYPVLDDMHFSELEYEAAYEDWGSAYGGQYYFAEFLAEEYELDPTTKEFLQDSDVAEDMFELSQECDCTYYSDNEGIKWDYRDYGLDRDKLAKAIMKMRGRLRRAS